MIRTQLLNLKFREMPYVYNTIGKFLENIQKSFEILKKYDIIIIVPTSNQRKKERGYNQSELIAKEISRVTGIPVVGNILIKIKDTLPQSSLNKKQREENAKNVYKIINSKKLHNKKILILDDIYTTGSTVNECSKLLIQKGIQKSNIGVLTIAKD